MTGSSHVKSARALALAVLLCISGTATQGQKQGTKKQSGPSLHSSRLRTTATSTVVPPSISTQPVSRSILAGQTASFSVAATGTAPLAYQWYGNGVPISGATSSAYTISAAPTSYNGMQFTAVVSNSAGSATSNAASLTLNPGTFLLNSSSTTLAFGSLNLSSSSTQNVILTNAGNSSVIISSVTVSGAGFNAGGGLGGVTLSPGQSATLSAMFSPATAGGATGLITVTSNATNSPTVVTLSGTGLAPVTHSIFLSWAPSASTVTGYNVYSGTISGGPYSKLTASPVASTNYADGNAATSGTYYYVVTAVGSTNVESSYSAEVAAIIP